MAIVFDLPEAVCQERNGLREGRTVAPRVISRQLEGVRQTLADPERLLAEGLAAVHILDSGDSVDQASVIRDGSLAPARGLAVARGLAAARDPAITPSRRPAGRRDRTV